MARSWERLLDEVARERYPRLLARAALLVTTRADAEDLVQDALVATFAGRARFTSVGEAEQYVRRAIVTRSIDRARTAAAERRAVERRVSWPDPADELVPTGLDRDIVEALQTLSVRQRACVVLRHVDDLSVEQTATALGLSAGAVKRYTSDGTARLQARLGTPALTGGTVPVELIPAPEVRRD
ncbi:sigma-70 family RNA polymerase sigma factor [Cellulomonas wangsupingiae]|uniref:Sigma-70 family RNA polymerase sigma factor n=1 Tax=Cellulomonas wangsupingiae TaxID=2968085 RepID=A0ABY5K871_9CELL|nr:sigma-70 family RNA polymerase sigma factor [Cellulomonas wangsupingiae]MCC2333893.1 sigma-70 family RNA polymerase sigma factor [Cellulomonas wangsupingiae]UUI65151.1 sigma-70 family RNA polymerase sigma factor [Cellulomonas wangsupingiae]